MSNKKRIIDLTQASHEELDAIVTDAKNLQLSSEDISNVFSLIEEIHRRSIRSRASRVVRSESKSPCRCTSGIKVLPSEEYRIVRFNPIDVTARINYFRVHGDLESADELEYARDHNDTARIRMMLAE